MCRTLRAGVASCIALIAAQLPAAACQPISPEFADVLSQSWSSAFANHDAVALDRIYAQDAVISSFLLARPVSTEPEMRLLIGGLVKNYEPVGYPVGTLRFGCGTILDFGHMTLRQRGERYGGFPVSYARLYERRRGHWLVVFEMMKVERGRATYSEADPVGAAPSGVYEAPVPRPVERRPDVAGVVMRSQLGGVELPGGETPTAPATERETRSRPAPRSETSDWRRHVFQTR